MPVELTRTSHSPAETELIAQSLARLLMPGDALLLAGDLGAGKTTLTRHLIANLGHDPAAAASPTFVVAHEHTDPAARLALIHIDAYRLRSPSDLDTIGWDRVLERLRRRDAALIVEWPDRLGPDHAGLDPASTATLTLEHAGEHARTMHLRCPEPWAMRDGFESLATRHALRCPITGQPVTPDNPHYPFATEQARLADLYRWMAGHYTISRPATSDDEPS
jgi:tRNA threonylcarbamoyladenosine biosynthesis protein TsaE